MCFEGKTSRSCIINLMLFSRLDDVSKAIKHSLNHKFLHFLLDLGQKKDIRSHNFMLANTSYCLIRKTFVRVISCSFLTKIKCEDNASKCHKRHAYYECLRLNTNSCTMIVRYLKLLIFYIFHFTKLHCLYCKL